MDRKELEEIIGNDCKGKLSVSIKLNKDRTHNECRYEGGCCYKKDYKGMSLCLYKDSID